MMGVILQVYKRILQDIDLFPGQRPLEKCSPCLTQSHSLFTTQGKINSSKKFYTVVLDFHSPFAVQLGPKLKLNHAIGTFLKANTYENKVDTLGNNIDCF